MYFPHPILSQRPEWRRRCTILRCWVAVLCAFTAAQALADDESSAAAHGLAVEYYAAGRAEPAVTRREGWPTFDLSAEETPDVRLSPGAWRLEAVAQLDAVLPGEYRLAADVQGRLKLEIAGQALLDVDTGADPSRTVESAAFRLESAQHPLRIEYAPGPAGAVLRLRWRHERFGEEPLPRQAATAPAAAESAEGVDEFTRGMLAIDQHRCYACHEGPLRQMLPARRGPTLKSAGRLQRKWLATWLADPAAHRPEATMPRLFAPDRAGEVERWAVAEYLMELAESDRPAAQSETASAKTDAAAGQRLFERIGCANCHRTFADRPAAVTLRNLSAKADAAAWESFLQDPAAIHPDGRMPRFSLSDEERGQLVAYLVTLRGETAAAAAPDELPPTAAELRDGLLRYGVAAETLAAQSEIQQRSELARRVMATKRCAECHELPGDAMPTEVALVSDLRQTTKWDTDCLAANAEPGAARHPRYAKTLDRQAAARFLREAAQLQPVSAPAAAARLTLARLNCRACHEFDGDGGLPRELEAALLAGQTEANAEAVQPPSLDGVAHKLTPAALEAVLLGAERARPWMSLRMPHFAGVERLPAQLVALQGGRRTSGSEASDPNEVAGEDERLNELRAAGRRLVGAEGFGCIKCHDLQGVASGGTRGPDLALAPRRIRREWYERWMTDPQRVAPGTRMPTVFLDGRSSQTAVLDGDPVQQRTAIWHYLAASHVLPLPVGVERATPQRLSAGQRPLVVRTFLPGLSARSMAVGMPNGVHLLFDGQMCRLAGMFQGGFLDMSAAWTGRGGSPARIEGTATWQSPPGFPWTVTAALSDEPDFSGRETDPALGGPVREAPPYSPSRLTFGGYTLAADGVTFRYTLAGEPHGGQANQPAATAGFVEKLATARTDLGVGVIRTVDVHLPLEHRVWLNVGECDAPPEIVRTEGTVKWIAQPAPAPGDVLQWTQDGQPLLARASGGAAIQWRLIPRGQRWQLLLSADAAAAADSPVAAVNLRLELWRPTPDRPEAAPGIARFLLGSGE